MINRFYKQGARAAADLLGLGAGTALGAGLGPYINPSPEGSTPEEKQEHDRAMRLRYGLMAAGAGTTGILGERIIGRPLGQRLAPNNAGAQTALNAGSNILSSIPGWHLGSKIDDQLRGSDDTDN